MSIEEAKRYLASNRVEGWLQESAAEVICAIAPKIDLAERPVAEIGVHHGKFLIFLGLLTRGRLAGFDLFERQGENVDSSGRGNKRKFLKNCHAYGLDAEKVSAVSVNSLDLSPEEIVAECAGSPVLFSVDGGHTAELTEHDLTVAARSVSSDGIVMLDDFFNSVFPEVSWGAVRFMQAHPGTLFPFCIVGGKTFFVRDMGVAREYADFLMGLRARDLEHVVQIDRCTFFGFPVCVMWSNMPAESARETLARTTVWRAIRNTPLGAAVRFLLGR